MSIRNKLMPYDLYERHTVVGQLLQKALGRDNSQTVLDVGGRKALLARFLPFPTTAINPDGTGHLLGDGGQLPFANNSFDAVVNLDTLEHLPSQTRLPFIQECLRVSQKCVIIAAPYGSPEHMQLEKALNAQYQQAVGKPHPYLSEHVAFGLPSPEQLQQFVEALRPFPTQLSYAGDFTWQGRSFARAVRAHQQPRLLARLTNLYNQLSGMALFHPINLSQTAHPTTNRFYLVITKQT
ncbi:MAG: methyltransferase domain-containing protein [Candidatus Promineifilaceae bacterium]|nr:class I SAM-dependent methyltransferase [Anaerolineaceae bacterium]